MKYSFIVSIIVSLLILPIENGSPVNRRLLQTPLSGRLSITSLSADQLLTYREAWTRITRGGTSSLYMPIAFDHGDPNYFCPHGNLKFLVWHRRYVKRLEELLEMPVPYWDWRVDDFPQAYTDTTYTNSQGRVLANPLYSGIMINGQMTARSNPMHLPKTQFSTMVTFAQSQNDFGNFSHALESVHDSVHGGVGGQMGAVSTSSFDPVFWAHHQFIDYLFWIWQTRHPDAFYPDEATGDIIDSTGTWNGADIIPDFQGWVTGRSDNDIRVAQSTAAAEFPVPHLFLTVKNVTAADTPAFIKVHVYDVELGSHLGFAMDGMNMTMYKDVYIPAQEGAAKLYDQHGVSADQIPNHAIITRTYLDTNATEILSDAEVHISWVN